MRDLWQEARELGVRDLAYRISWEARLRLGLLRLAPPTLDPVEASDWQWPPDLRFSPADTVKAVMSSRLQAEDVAELERLVGDVEQGRLLYFGRWPADCGQPPDWHRDPTTGARCSGSEHWTRSLSGQGDIKFIWEMGRFPQAYHLARASAHSTAIRDRAAVALAAQLASFIAANPFELGPHWASGQEIALRVIAWCFALGVFGEHPSIAPLRSTLQRTLLESGAHVEHFLEFSRNAVRNNHLIAEGLVLYLLSFVLPLSERARRWRRSGAMILDAEASRQFYPDGGYILQSHNYERGALQYYLLAIACARAHGETEPSSWMAAVDRSLEFLLDLQDEESGRLPNYGANDGSLPAILSVCDRMDFRPTLQAASYASRGELVYRPGPWDEETAWLFGPAALSAPVRSHLRKSSHRVHSGHVVLRGDQPGTFATFRCGSIRDRYSQMDMLHVDVWWRGYNVLADPGTFTYHDAAWHRHFQGTASHNTVMVDGHDQMIYRRRFKNIHWTKARVTRFEDTPDWALVSGEHDGFRRLPRACVHRRSVLMVKDFLWIVVDSIHGGGGHDVRCQWLTAEAGVEDPRGGLELRTAAGPFWISTFDGTGAPAEGNVTQARADPPRGWLSRYYGLKEPALSLVVERRTNSLPLVTCCSGAPFDVTVRDGYWSLTSAVADVGFRLDDVGIGQVDVKVGASKL